MDVGAGRRRRRVPRQPVSENRGAATLCGCWCTSAETGRRLRNVKNATQASLRKRPPSNRKLETREPHDVSALDAPSSSGCSALIPPAHRLPAPPRVPGCESTLAAARTLVAYAIPVSLAYACLAGLPPEHGICSYLDGGVAYVFLALLVSSPSVRPRPFRCWWGPPGRHGGRRCGARSADCRSDSIAACPR